LVWFDGLLCVKTSDSRGLYWLSYRLRGSLIVLWSIRHTIIWWCLFLYSGLGLRLIKIRLVWLKLVPIDLLRLLIMFLLDKLRVIFFDLNHRILDDARTNRIGYHLVLNFYGIFKVLNKIFGLIWNLLVYFKKGCLHRWNYILEIYVSSPSIFNLKK
jgi:hypothetical protein